MRPRPASNGMSSEIEILPTSVPRTRDDFLFDARTISTFTNRLHLDVTDGDFTKDHSWPFYERGMLGEVTFADVPPLFIEVHLMVKEPRELGLKFIDAGTRRLIAHTESFASPVDMQHTLEVWRSRGAEAGLALLIDTPIHKFAPQAEICDFVHLMTIASIGSQGIPFDARGMDRVRVIHANFRGLTISVDGGVSEQNIGEMVRSGARRFSVGTAVMKAMEPSAAYGVIKIAAESALY